MWIRKLTWLAVLLAVPAWGKVLVRWTAPAVPAVSTLGVHDLVIRWSAGRMPQAEVASKAGYHVYIEAGLRDAPSAAEWAERHDLTGLVLDAGDSVTPAEQQAHPLRAAHPNLRVLVLGPDGKPPQMRGSTVVDRNGVLQVSSPTEQPWIDSNLALVRLERGLLSTAIPLYGFEWQTAGSLDRRQGPRARDYALAAAESGAFHADLILDLPANLQDALARGTTAERTAWNEVRRTIEFAARNPDPALVPEANVGVVTDAFGTSYEAVNLMARHNIPFRVLGPGEVTAANLRGLDLLVMLATPDDAGSKAVVSFVTRGGTAVLAGLPHPFAWQPAHAVQTGDHPARYAVGAGKAVVLDEPVTDPETFARDVRRLIGAENLPISLWNALTTLAVPYHSEDERRTVVELVNYSQEPIEVQVRIKGSFPSIRYETPEDGCCRSLAASESEGFTEFVVPRLEIAGRVYLADRSTVNR